MQRANDRLGAAAARGCAMRAVHVPCELPLVILLCHAVWRGRCLKVFVSAELGRFHEMKFGRHVAK